MERIAYTNKDGQSIYENVEKFSIKGTIMSASRNKVGNCTVHNLYVEDSKGGYHVVVWNNAKGYDADKLRTGYAISVKGVVHFCGYMGADGTPKTYKKYSAHEIG